MARVLITGMSGVGKSSVTVEIARRGRRAVDLDDSEWSEWVDADPSDDLTPRGGKDWVWRTDRVSALLEAAAGEELFVSGCAENMAAVYPSVDLVILLSAPIDTIMDRLAARPEGDHGHLAADRRKTAELIASVEPLIRAGADHEIDARLPLGALADEVIRLAARGRKGVRP